MEKKDVKDKGTGEWIRSKEAARILGICIEYLNHMAQAGKIVHCAKEAGKNGYARLYYRPEIEWLATRPERQRHREQREARARRQAERLSPTLPEGERLLTSREAAALLGVSRPRLTRMLKQGALTSYQERPGQGGSKHLFPLSRVEALRDNPEHQRRRNAWEGGNSLSEGKDKERGQRAAAVPGPEWLTRIQAMALLGVSSGTLTGLRRTRGLTCIRGEKRARNGRRLLLYRRDDRLAWNLHR